MTTDDYFAEADYLRQVSWLLATLMAEANRRRIGHRADDIPLIEVSILEMVFRFICRPTYGPTAKIRVTDGIAAIGEDWVASYVPAKKTKSTTGSFVRVTGNTEAFERDMLMLKIKRSN